MPADVELTVISFLTSIDNSKTSSTLIKHICEVRILLSSFWSNLSILAAGVFLARKNKTNLGLPLSLGAIAFSSTALSR